MLKSVFIPAMISVLSLFGFFASEVTIDMNLPTTANAGAEILVELTINKGDLTGFARFQQDLPPGFTAVARQTSNGDFRFEDQKVKIQWTQLPFDQTMNITYAIEISPSVSGNFNFEGKFSYILNNAVQSASTGPKTITIVADESAAELAANAQTTYTYQGVNLKNIDCIRQKPFLNQDNEVIVNLLVNKGDLNQYGKIQEEVPRGYNAVSLKSKNSIFTFKNHIIKFLWMNMPADPQFVVSYKLVPEGEIPDQAFIINGTFSYAINDRTTTIPIAERNVDLSKYEGEELVAQQTQPTNPPVEEPKQPVTQPEQPVTQTEQPVNQQQPTDNNLAVVTENKTNTQTEPVKPKETKQETPKTKTQPVSTYPSDMEALTGIPSPEEGISYRVQIAAGHKLVSKNYFKKLNITDQVQTEIHEGWHKYTIGNFTIYKDARDYRDYVWNNTPIHDAFVAAYNNGIRITVQEALMIANQKWYK